MQTSNAAGIFGAAATTVFLVALMAGAAALLVPASALADGGWVILVETSVLLVAVIVPVIWRWVQVGLSALTEPLSMMSAAFLLYYVLRGQLLMVRELLDSQDQLLQMNPATKMDIALALGYAIAGFLAFHLGYRFWSPPRASARKTWVWDSAKILRVAMVGVPIAIFSTVVQIYAAGGPASALANIGRLRDETVGYGYLLTGVGYWPIVFAFTMADCLRKKRIPVFPLLCLAAGNISCTLDGNRSGVLTSWLTGALLYVSSRGKQRVTRKTVVTTIVLVLGVGFLLPMARVREQAGSVDDAERIGREYWASETSGIVVGALGEFCALDTFSALVAAGPSQFPFRYGGTYLDTILFAIPRTLFPDKPRSFSYVFGAYLIGSDSDIPPGYIGELYINFGVPGILAGMYLMGLVLRRIHRWTSGGNPVAITCYAVFAPYIIVFMGRSLIGGGTLTIIPLVLMLPIVYYLRQAPAHRDRYRLGGMPGFPRQDSLELGRPR